MPSFGTSSRRRLDTCHPLLVMLWEAVVRRRDCSITEGRRSKERQNELYEQGRTKPGQIVTHVQWPDSKHNVLNPNDLSRAVDAVPYPEKWDSVKAFDELAEIVWDEWEKIPPRFKSAWELEWGGDWEWKDRPHWQIVPKDKS